MSDDALFDMPPAPASFEARGGWVTNALAAKFNLSQMQAAGFVGNPGYESEGFEKLQEENPMVAGSRGGYGWSQWTGPRRISYELWCKKSKLDPVSDQANYGYLCVELETSFGHMLASLRQIDDLENAVAFVERIYEGPAESRVADRLVWARRALAGAQGMVSEEVVATVPAWPPSRILRYGCELGADVEELQRRLGSLRVDGNFGRLTERAVRAFQKKSGIIQDGIVGRTTAGFLA